MSYRLTPEALDTPGVRTLHRARLPKWCLSADWPLAGGEPLAADIMMVGGYVSSVQVAGANSPAGAVWDIDDAPVLPCFVDAHTHVDKAFTAGRLDRAPKTLVDAIVASDRDSHHWTRSDLMSRANRALALAFEAGVSHLRTHVDWRYARQQPLAWSVLQELSDFWLGRLRIERVALSPLGLYSQPDQALSIGRQVAASESPACLGAYVHTSNWNAEALRNLFVAASRFNLDVDLHIDEELSVGAVGLTETTRIMRDLNFHGRTVCGHACALAAQDHSVACRTLDSVSQLDITLVSLPITNLWLQDAHPDRTPRARGVTLVKEARARGIKVLIASDNVQDAFCPVGSFDPIDAMAAGLLSMQLDSVFDTWSDSLCRADWLSRRPAQSYSIVGTKADLTIFTDAEAPSWPSQANRRVVLRDGMEIDRGLGHG
jgi:cytosine/creatinine deaminase